MSTLTELKREMAALADPKRAKGSAWYFQTGRGGYGEGDRFLGIRVPAQRALAKRWKALPLADAWRLLASPIHEHRLTALFILVARFERAGAAERGRIARGYLARRRHVDNWDLVDSSSPHILGAWLLDRSRTVLTRLARSRRMWDRRIAMLATQRLIRAGESADVLKLATMLLHDEHPLIHKAVGWMLRDVGTLDRARLDRFLTRHAATMPRVMLAYATEKLPAGERLRYRAMKSVAAGAGRPRAKAVLRRGVKRSR